MYTVIITSRTRSMEELVVLDNDSSIYRVYRRYGRDIVSIEKYNNFSNSWDFSVSDRVYDILNGNVLWVNNAI